METRRWTLCFATPKYSDYTQYYTKQTGKGPGYCYMIGRGPNCCLVGHVTGIFLSSRGNLSTLYFQLNRLLNQYVLGCFRQGTN